MERWLSWTSAYMNLVSLSFCLFISFTKFLFSLIENVAIDPVYFSSEHKLLWRIADPAFIDSAKCHDSHKFVKNYYQ